MCTMKGFVLSVVLVLVVSLQDVQADGPDQSGAIGGTIVSAIVIAVCAICCYRRCCQRSVVVQTPPAAVANAQAVQQIQIVAPPAQQFIPVQQPQQYVPMQQPQQYAPMQQPQQYAPMQPQQPFTSPTGGPAPMPTMGNPNAPQFDAPPSYFEK